MARRFRIAILPLLVTILWAAETVDHPFLGITSIVRTETAPRRVTMHIVLIDLTAHGIRFKLTPPGGSLETIRQTTLNFLNQQHAQVAINAHFFMPFPSPGTAANLIGLAASDGNVYSGFESPEQNYALVAYAPAINIDRSNHASVVHYDGHFSDGRHILEHVTLWTTVAGSAQIVTNGVKTIPGYRDAQHPDGLLQQGGTRTSQFSNRDSWYDRLQARTAIGLTQDEKTLVWFTVDRAAGSQGMKLGEVADVLVDDYKVYNALNLDGGGSTTMVLENRSMHKGALFNTSSDNANGRSVGSNLAVFAEPPPSLQ
jgi:exopolysaccharide biosynthesis protein